MCSLPSYVVVTPARNEAAFLELTICSVAAQQVRPLKWVIVSDGSTDGTDAIVERYAAEHAWIELLRMPERTERHFAGKAGAFRAGWERMQGIPYEVLACLDADITFEPDYFQFLLSRLQQDEQLGIVGTPYVDTTSEVYDFRFVSTEHVSGACQVFRRACLEAIGGYAPSRIGGIDSIAVISARLQGWKTKTFIEKHSQHHRELGTAEQKPLRARWVLGCRDYMLGNLPLWELFRVLYQMTKRPFVVRGMAVGWGFVQSWAKQTPRPVSAEFVRFVRREQWARMRRLTMRWLRGN